MRYWNRNFISAVERPPSTTESGGIFDLNSYFVFKSDSLWPVEGVVQQGLILHLDAGNTNSYPGSGTTWSDLTSTNGDATLMNGAFYSSNDGGYIDFDGTNDYARIPSSSWSVGNLFNGSNNFTISLWINIDSFPTNTNYIYSPVLFSPAEGHVYLTIGDGVPVNKIGLRTYLGAWTSPVSSNTLSTNTWYNICATYDSSSGFTLYQDGTSVSTSSSTGSIGTQTRSYTLIGGSTAANQYRYLNGSISSLLVYNRALTSTEVSDNYDVLSSRYSGGGSGGSGSSLLSNTVLYLDAGDSNSYPGSGSTWNDLSTTGNDATIYNAGYSSSDGGYFYFDGTNDYLTFSSTQNFGNAISISVWVYPSLDSSINTFISNKGSATATGFAFYANSYNTTNRNLVFEVANGSSITSATSSNNVVSDSQWQNFVVTCNRSTGATVFYKNGYSIATATLSITDWGNTAAFQVGKFPPVNAYQLDARLSIFQIQTRVITASEVLSEYNAVKSRYGL